jgi:hypothetical protein
MKVSIPRVRNYLLPLPAHVKLAVNQKLRDGWRHRAVSDWLFAQIADRDIPEHLLKAGDPYALIWIRNARDPIVAQENCRTTVSHWFEGYYYADWLAQQPDITTDFESQEVVDLALKVIWKKIEFNPKAVALFNKLRDIVDNSKRRF